MSHAPAKKLDLKPGLKVLCSPLLESVSGLVHGFSTRRGGHSQVYGDDQFNLGFTAADKRDAVQRNRADFLVALGAEGSRLLTLKQIHSDIVQVVTSPEELPSNGKSLTGDTLVTNLEGVLLAVQTADCVPILVADIKQGVVAAIHAGWRGTAKRIAEKTAGAMRARFGCKPQNLRAAIGPAIRQCCYAVGEEVIEEFESQFAYAKKLFSEVYDKDPVKKKYPLLFMTARAPGHSDIGPQIHLDLIEANRRQLLDAGVAKKNIWAAEECTSCRTDLLFSHRAEDGYTGRLMAAIGLKSR
ncbi:MAG TPA: peptidoglycan editing factor PgeF [Terriglobales bacterium]